MRATLIVIYIISQSVATQAQEKRITVGYNSFNEVYAGYQLPRGNPEKLNIELGFQFALTTSANAGGGPGIFAIRNPFLTNNASGVRFRLGYQTPYEGGESLVCVQFEYQNLASNKIIYSPPPEPRTFTPYSEYTETYAKYGIRFCMSIPIFKSRTFFFTYSLAIQSVNIHRTYEVEGFTHTKVPSDREEDIEKIGAQFTIGMKVNIF